MNDTRSNRKRRDGKQKHDESQDLRRRRAELVPPVDLHTYVNWDTDDQYMDGLHGPAMNRNYMYFKTGKAIQNEPWMTSELRELNDQVSILNRRYRDSQSISLRKQFREARNELAASVRKAKMEYHSKKSEESGKGSFPKYNETKACGRKYIVARKGFYCHLCQRLFAEEDEATVQHCMEWQHYRAVKHLKFPLAEDMEVSKDDEDNTKAKDEKDKEKTNGDDGDKAEDYEDNDDVSIENYDELLKEDD